MDAFVTRSQGVSGKKSDAKYVLLGLFCLS